MKRNHLRMLALGAVCAGFGGALKSNGANEAPAASVAVQNVQRAPEMVPAPKPANPALAAARAVLDGVGIESGVHKAQVQTALNALAGQVRKQSDPGALRMAFQAYFAFKAENPEQVRKPYLYYVDYGLSSTTPRGYVFNMETLEVVDGPFTVAHGRGSAPRGESVPTRFSNIEGSATSSLGLFLAQETYAFSGKAGGKRYSSIGLRMKGLSGRFNSAARQRRVVTHGAPYVTAAKAGRSEGCPAMEQARARNLLPKIGNGGLVFLFSPRDKTWMSQDPWANRDIVDLPSLAAGESSGTTAGD